MRIFRALGLATIILIAIAALPILAFLADVWWYRYKAATPKSSLTELNDMVYVGIPAKTVHWQVFGTPEHMGGVPGPTEYISLVAELAPSDKAWFDRLPSKPGKVLIMPEAPRAWLPPHFRALLTKQQNGLRDIATMPACRRHSAAMTRSGRVVDGFVCWSPESTLLYLSLDDMTGQASNAN